MNIPMKRIPGPPWYSVPYKIFRARRNPLDAIAREINEHGDIVRFEIGPINVYFVAHPDHINHILVKNSQNYSRLTVDYLAMRPVLGQGLVTTDGPVWQKQRQALQPEFHKQKINALVQKISATTETVLSSWNKRLAKNKTMDMATEMADLALRIAANALFGVDSSVFPTAFSEAAVFVNRYADQNATQLFKIPSQFPTSRNLRFRKALKVLDSVVYKIIHDHRHNGDYDDLVSMMINTADPGSGKYLNDREIRDQALTILITGHETSANALAWTLFLLSKHPDIAKRVQAEVDTLRGSELPVLEQIKKLDYLKRVLQESMRLYPPVWSISRQALANDVLGDYSLPKNAYLYISFYAIHHHPKYWQDAERFNPDRFLPEQIEKQHRYAYLPFGAGPHLCIGRDFAMLEMQIILSMVLQRYQLELVPGSRIEAEPLITLRPKYGMHMLVNERN